MDLETDRERLLERLRREIEDERVLETMARVPRELFVPAEGRRYAYDDRPLPIGQGQTISQPFIVALMTQSMELTGNEKVLELGTGCGYQTAILSKLVKKVVTIERIEALARMARETLNKLGYKNVEVHLSTDKLGWPPEAPYDAIMVTAAAPSIPSELLEQLRGGGRLVIPVGSRWEQNLLQVVKRDGEPVVRNLTACRFVPLIGEGAWSEE